jgi:hypothetical protein
MRGRCISIQAKSGRGNGRLVSITIKWCQVHALVRWRIRVLPCFPYLMDGQRSFKTESCQANVEKGVRGNIHLNPATPEIE